MKVVNCYVFYGKQYNKLPEIVKKRTFPATVEAFNYKKENLFVAWYITHIHPRSDNNNSELYFDEVKCYNFEVSKKNLIRYAITNAIVRYTYSDNFFYEDFRKSKTLDME